MRIFGLTADWSAAPIIIVIAENFQAALKLTQEVLSNSSLPWDEPHVKVLWSFETPYQLPVVLQIIEQDNDASEETLSCMEKGFFRSEKVGAGLNARVFVYPERISMFPYICMFTRDGWVVDPSTEMDEELRSKIKEFLNNKYPNS